MFDLAAGAQRVQLAPENAAQGDDAKIRLAEPLGRAIGRPAVAPLPAPAVRAMFGEMGERLLLEVAMVRPSVLQEAGFRFALPGLEEALRFELGRFA